MPQHPVNKQSFLINLDLFLFFLLQRLHHHNFWNLPSKNIFCVVSNMGLELWRVILLVDYFDEVAFELTAHVNFHKGAALAA